MSWNTFSINRWNWLPEFFKPIGIRSQVKFPTGVVNAEIRWAFFESGNW